MLDKDTLYIDENIAQGLGWEPGRGLDGVQLPLHGWEKGYSVITRKGTDAGWNVDLSNSVRLKLTSLISELLAKGTIESSRNPIVLKVLEGLKDV
ncbi:hypothetical protein FRC20_007107 [Serendipita sp. 405]|nr:hypothetical protein FRC15_007026 [Serendipita sp. 397]KAG8836250.1 hypothetical protein FRC20_007107 [Serendipita sp. 405]